MALGTGVLKPLVDCKLMFCGTCYSTLEKQYNTVVRTNGATVYVAYVFYILCSTAALLYNQPRGRRRVINVVSSLGA